MEFGYDFWLFIVRWLHVLSGVMWIGLLWYFNFVQTPTVPTIPEDLRPAIPKHIMPVALFWFRWAAVSTVVWGLILAWMNGYLAPVISYRSYRQRCQTCHDRHRYVDGLDYGVQRLVYYLAKPAEGHRACRSWCRGKAEGGTGCSSGI